MKSKEEIEQLAKIAIPLSYNNQEYIEFAEHDRKQWVNGYTQCQEDMVKEIQSLIDGYKSDILLLEEEFREGSSVLTLEKIVTLQDVINNLEAKFYIKY